LKVTTEGGKMLFLAIIRVIHFVWYDES